MATRQGNPSIIMGNVVAIMSAVNKVSELENKNIAVESRMNDLENKSSAHGNTLRGMQEGAREFRCTVDALTRRVGEWEEQKLKRPEMFENVMEYLHDTVVNTRRLQDLVTTADQ